MQYFLYLIFFLVSLGQLQRFAIFDGASHMYLHEIAMITFVAAFILRNKLTLAQKGNRVTPAVAIFIGTLAISLLWRFWQFSPLQNLVGFLYLARLILYFAFFMVLARLKESKESLKLGRAIDFYALLTIIFSFSQYFLYPNLRNLSYLGWDPHQYRAFGTFFDTTTSGVIFALLLLWSLSRIVDKKKGAIISYLMATSLFILLLLSYSRIAYISFFVGSIYYLYNRLSLSKIFFFTLSFLVLIIILPQRSGESTNLTRVFTIQGRLESMREGARLWIKNPILGVGYNRIEAVRKNALPQNHSSSAFTSSYITILASSGIIGFLALLNLLGVMFNNVDRLSKSIIIIVLSASAFDNVLFQNFVLFILLSFCVFNLSRK